MGGFDPDKLVVVAGMPRSGTTSLYQIFDQHPGCFVPFRKETAYFSYNFYKGEAWYRGLYDVRPEGQPAMDISPQYFGDLRAIDRIKALAPNARVILSVRDPVEWIKSSFFQTNKFEKKPDFATFVDGYTVTGARETVRFEWADGFVTKAIEAFRKNFGDNLLLYRFELFREDPVRVLQAIERFCGMEPYYTAETYKPTKVNSTYQYNSRLLTWILSREAVISAIDAIFPRPFIRRVRLAVDKMTMPEKGPECLPLTEEEHALAERRFVADRDFIDALFKTAPIQTGTGAPFEAATLSGAPPAQTVRSA
jgi:hypothetical protein